MEVGDPELRGAMPKIVHQKVELELVLRPPSASIAADVGARLEEVRDTFIPGLGAVLLGHRELKIVSLENLAEEEEGRIATVRGQLELFKIPEPGSVLHSHWSRNVEA